jgi:sarcosine oxidase
MIAGVPTRPAASAHHDCIVIGAGILGLSAAWSLSRRGRQVLVLDADLPGHPGSGSKGTARIFRLSYPEPPYVDMALRALTLWQGLETESGRRLLHRTGQLSFGAQLDKLADSMRQAGAPFEELSPTDVRRRYPHLAVDGPALAEEVSGVLEADACLQTLRDTGSFTLRPQTTVDHIEDGPQVPTVFLRDGATLSARVVVNCAGPATYSLMEGEPPPVAAPPTLQQVIYLRVPEAPNKGQGHVPIFIEWSDDMIYGLPVIGQPRFKLSHHTPGPVLAPGDNIDHDSLERDDPGLVELLCTAAQRLFPNWSPTPLATERCLYDNTADTHFVIDRVGHIVLGCGTSGHGFKFGPLLGELMADLATGVEPGLDVAAFAAGRTLPGSSGTP